MALNTLITRMVVVLATVMLIPAENRQSDFAAAMKSEMAQQFAHDAISTTIHTALGVIGAIPLVGGIADAADTAYYAAQGDYAGAALSGASIAASALPGVDQLAAGSKLAHLFAASKANTVNKLATAGEDLFVGSYSQSRRGNIKTGLNSTHTPHHAVQNAISQTSHGKGVTINIRKPFHEKTRTYRKPIEKELTQRQHLYKDVMDLRNILREANYPRSTVNRQLQDLISA